MNNNDTKDIESIFHQLAAIHGLRLGYNTHYDAYNYEFSWWKGIIHHRLDFQSINDSLVVTHLTDRYTFFPRVCYWLHSVNPDIFRIAPTVEFTRMGTIKLDSEKEIKTKVEELLKRFL